MERALNALAHEPVETLDPAVKAKHKQLIIERAGRFASVSAKPRVSFAWLGWSTGVLAVAAVLVLAVSLVLNIQDGGRLRRGAGVISALAIPAAHAADAFDLAAERADAAGMETDAGWTIMSKVDVSASDLENAMAVDPPVAIEVRPAGTNAFRVVPQEPLKPGEVYTVSIATRLVNDDGSTAGREFSWAVQTKDEFRVIAMVPGNGSSGVPVDTGIEFTFSLPGFEAPTDAWSISPVTPGRFEVRGRTLAFVPDQPLAPGTVYEVKLAGSYGVAGSDRALGEDASIRFETAASAETISVATEPMSHDELVHFRPNQTAALDVYLGYHPNPNDDPLSSVDVTGYRVTREQAKQLLEARLAIPPWAEATRNKFEGYQAFAGAMAFQATVNLERQEYSTFLRLPTMTESGFYILRFQPRAPSRRAASWAIVQVSDTAYYVTSDANQTLVWAIDSTTRRPYANAPIRLGEQSVTADGRGLATLQTPPNLAVRPEQPQDIAYAVAEIGEGQRAALAVLGGLYYEPFWGQATDLSKTWSYLEIDRPLYRLTDELHVVGLAQDRETYRGAGELTLRVRDTFFLLRGGIGGDEGKVYAETKLTTDEAGRFDGTLAWPRLAPRWYQLELVRDGKVIATRSFEVREFAKPSYSIEIVPDREHVYAGDTVAGVIRARFFDGTPVAKPNLMLRWNGEAANDQTVVVGDEFGTIRFSIPTARQTCPLPDAGKNEFCPAVSSLWITATPVVGEEGDISGTANVQVYSGAIELDAKAEAANGSAELTLSAWNRDLNDEEDRRSTPATGIRVEARILGRSWVRVEDGTEYDPIEKRVRPRYRYEERFDPPVDVALVTDGQGSAAHRFAVADGKNYQVFLRTVDQQGRLTQETVWVYTPYGGAQDEYPLLTLSPKTDGESKYVVDQPFEASLTQGGQPFDVSQTPGVLFIAASRGIQSATVETAANKSFRFSERFVPNAEIHAITYTVRGFQTAQASAVFARDLKEIKVEVTADKTAYAPGETVLLRARATRPDGSPARNVKLSYAAVDKALLALGYDQKPDPLAAIYAYVSDGLVFVGRSKELGSQIFGPGGAEGGGGGAGDLRMGARKNFKDTAGFGVVETDGSGEALIRFTVPDNLTTWSVDLIALGTDLSAGAARAEVPVTKSVFVDLVAAPRLLFADKPVFKLRAYGQHLPEGTNVTFRLDAPTLGIRDQRVSGKVGDAVFVTPSALPIGRHVVVVGVETPNGNDALERLLVVTPTNFLKDEYVSIEAAPGTSLPALGTAEADVAFLAKNRAALLPTVHALAWNSTARLDGRLAALLMADVLHADFASQDVPELDPSLGIYQDPSSGGLKLLPYGSVDETVTAEVAATAPDRFDTAGLAAYFWRLLDAKGVEREARIRALAALASLKEPVLAQLQEAAGFEDLSWREELWIARGLAAAGDLERSRALLDRLLARGEERDAVFSLNVSEDLTENYEATADAAALAASLAHPKAEALKNYVETNWDNEAFPVLAKVRYVQAVIPTLLSRTISLSYVVGNGEAQTLTFTDEPVIIKRFTESEAAQFIVTRVDGPVEMVFVRRVAGRPTPVPEVSIARSYEPLSGTPGFHEGDIVKVRLVARFGKDAQDGCYNLRDHLPGGFQPVVDWNVAYGEGLAYPYGAENGEVSFVACKDPDRPTEIEYIARVVARGTYRAEAPVLQHMQFPAVTALGQDVSIEITE